MTRAETIESILKKGVDVRDMTPTPLTGIQSGEWRWLYSNKPASVDVKLSAGSATFYIETGHDDSEANGSPVDGPITLTGIDQHYTYTPFSSTVYIRIRRTDAAGDDLTATLTVIK